VEERKKKVLVCIRICRARQVCSGRLPAASCGKTDSWYSLALTLIFCYVSACNDWMASENYHNEKQTCTSSLLCSRTHLIWRCVLRNYSGTFTLKLLCVAISRLNQDSILPNHFQLTIYQAL
jgi:hypothetical protein